MISGRFLEKIKIVDRLNVFVFISSTARKSFTSFHPCRNNNAKGKLEANKKRKKESGNVFHFFLLK